jgi:ribosomal protein S12 methylthiotransferase accessory factor
MNNNSPRHDPGPLRDVWRWVDRRFGIIRSISSVCLVPPEPRWWVYGCELARAPIGTWHSLQDFSAAGCSIDPDQALRSALGEAVERYCGLAELDDLRVQIAPLENELNRKLPLCAADEPCPKPFRRRSRHTRLTTYPMRRLSGRGDVMVPAGWISLGFVPAADEPTITLPISTGLAFHHDLRIAIWRGLCEAAERDAVMLMWWTHRPAREVRPDSTMPNGLAERFERLHAARLDVRLFDVTTDFRVPTIFCIVRSERYPYCVVGAACHDEPALACAKAMDEAVSIRVALRAERWAADVPSFANFDWVQRLEHHMLLYAGWRDSPALDFLVNGRGATCSFREFSAQDWRTLPADMTGLARLGAELEAQDLDVLWTDLTTPEAADFGVTVKVFVPQMMPLSIDHRVRWLGTPRLRQAAARTGQSLNPFPHPFA